MQEHAQTIIDTSKVLGINAAAGIVTITNINAYLTTISILAAICYTIWKWGRDYKKIKK